MSDCSFTKERLTAWIDEETSALENRDIETHLDFCPDCMAEAQSLRETIAWQKQNLTDALLDAPVDVTALRQKTRRQIEALRAEAQRPPRWSWIVHPRILAAAAAAAVLLVLWKAPQSEPLLVSLGVEPPPAEVAKRADKYRYLELIENLDLLEHLEALQSLPREDERSEAGGLWKG